MHKSFNDMFTKKIAILRNKVWSFLLGQCRIELLVEQTLAKSRLVKAEHLPISKMENDCMKYLARCWSFLDRRN